MARGQANGRVEIDGRELDALEPRQGALPRRRLPQSRRHRLLPPDCARACSPTWPGGRPRSCGRRTARRQPVLREELPGAITRMGRGRHPARGDRRNEGLPGRRRRRRSSGSRTSPRSSCTRTSGRWPTRSTRPRSCSTSIPARPRRSSTAVASRSICATCSTQLDLQCVVKTSGGKGLHLSVPLDGSTATDDDTKHFALALGQLLESRDPKRVLVDMAKAETPGQGVRRLESERPAQDDGLRVLAAPARPADRLDAAGAGTKSHDALDAATATRSRSRRPTCSSASPSTATSTPTRSRCSRSCPRSSVAAWNSTGKVAIVTGASARCRAPRPRCCSRERGCKVVCAARATDAAPLPIPGTIDDTVRRITDAGGDAIAVPTNLADDAEVERMVAHDVEHFGRVDMLVNNAAITFPGDLDLDDEALRSRDAGRPAGAAHRDPGRAAVDEGARRRFDRQHLVGRRAQLHPGPDGVRHGEGRARTPHRVGRAPARARSTSRSTRSASTCRSRRKASCSTCPTPTTPTGNRRRSRPRASCGCSNNRPSYTGHNDGHGRAARRARDHGVAVRTAVRESGRTRYRDAPAAAVLVRQPPFLWRFSACIAEKRHQNPDRTTGAR